MAHDHARRAARREGEFLQWRNVAEPIWHMTSKDGGIDCSVEYSHSDYAWGWGADLWRIKDGKRVELLAHGGGKCKTDDEGKRKVAEWLKANL